MCISLAQDGELQLRALACDELTGAEREALALLLAVIIDMANAKGAGLFPAADELPILVGEVQQADWPAVRRISERRCAASGEARPDVELKDGGEGLIEVTLRETRQTPPQRLALWGAPPLADTQRAGLRTACRALLACLRAQREARAAADARRVQQRQIEQLTQAKAAAEAASRAASVLVCKVGHELRTPLNAIVGLSQLIRLERAGSRRAAPVDGWVEQIASTGRHMAGLIETLMQLGPSAAGRLSLAPQCFDVREPLFEACRIIDHEAVKRGVVIVTDAVMPATVSADRGAVRQVLLNLLSNAIKYNREGGHVAVTVRNGPRARIVVRDTGPGLTAEQCARLFLPFERLGAERTGVEGHGLGLLVCKELLAAMGGTIDIESTPGAGCTFTVTLPAPGQAMRPEARCAIPGRPLVGPVSAMPGHG